VGLRYFIPITFVVKAADAKEAAKRAREIGRVKHDHTDAILGVREITEFEAGRIRKELKRDPYMKAGNKAQMKAMLPLIADRLVEDPHFEKTHGGYRSEDRRTDKELFHHKTRIRHPKAYARMYGADEAA